MQSSQPSSLNQQYRLGTLFSITPRKLQGDLSARKCPTQILYLGNAKLKNNFYKDVNNINRKC